jgi:hypothetical protein
MNDGSEEGERNPILSSTAGEEDNPPSIRACSCGPFRCTTTTAVVVVGCDRRSLIVNSSIWSNNGGAGVEREGSRMNRGDRWGDEGGGVVDDEEEVEVDDVVVRETVWRGELVAGDMSSLKV